MSSETLSIIILALTLFTCKGEDNLLCDSWNIVAGTWKPLNNIDCALITTDYGAGNIVWFGSSNGENTDSHYDRNTFELKVQLSIYSNGDAGVMFRCGEASITNNEGPLYYVGISAEKEGVVFESLHNGWTQQKWTSYSLDTNWHNLTIKGSGKSYRVYLDAKYVTEMELSNFNGGGIGIRTYKAMAKYSSVTLSYPTITPVVPTLSPTNPPTLSPTSKPMTPTTVPTRSPTVSPTMEPTVHLTPDPTMNPTTNPTAKPSLNPSSSPTTPASTHPGELICGSHTNGDYSGKPVRFEVSMPFDGDMKMDLSGSDFNISSIIAYDSSHNEFHITTFASTLTLNDLVHGGDYSFEITGVDGVTSGTFDIVIDCTSDAPTRSPSMEPTESPITDPTWSPTVDPTTEAEAITADNFTFNWTLTVIIFSSLLSVPACAFCWTHCFPKSCYKPKVYTYSEQFV